MDLHDAALENIAVSWGDTTATLRFLTQEGPVCLVARGLRSLSVAMEEPWGPSVSVNELRGPEEAAGDVSRWVIEMQSGDLVELVAERLDVEPS